MTEQINQKIQSMVKTNVFEVKNGIFSFIPTEEQRPEWGKLMEEHYSTIPLKMADRYGESRGKIRKEPLMQAYFKYITETEGIIIDLASGPSGYFGPALDLLREESVFVITDACPTVLKAHEQANRNRKNVVVFDIDLDLSLPLQDESVDVYCGNLISNVDQYAGLLKEIYRTLKKGGKFASRELFFEEGTESCRYLQENNRPTATLETYLDYAAAVGFTVVNTCFEHEEYGRKEGDVLPVNASDRMIYEMVYLEK